MALRLDKQTDILLYCFVLCFMRTRLSFPRFSLDVEKNITFFRDIFPISMSKKQVITRKKEKYSIIYLRTFDANPKNKTCKNTDASTEKSRENPEKIQIIELKQLINQNVTKI